MLDVLEIAARAGGDVLNKYFRKTFTTSHKDNRKNIVTQADIESQQIIHDTILSEMAKKGYDTKNIGFIGEENLKTEGEHIFIIDPLDGTTNFSVGFDYFCIPIAYAHNGVIEAAIVHHPVHNLLYVAKRGAGAHKVVDGKKHKLDVDNKPLIDTVLVAHLSSDPALKKVQLNVITNLQHHSLGFRYMGSVALDHVYFTDNMFGAVLNSRTFIWDTAATQLIIEEAGGMLVDWTGRSLEYDFSNPKKQYNSIAVHSDNLATIIPYL